MIADWIGAVPAILAAIAVVYVPGLALLAVTRIRGLALLAFAPVAGVAIVGISALVLGIIGVRWTPLSFAAAAAATVAIGFGVRVLLTDRIPAPRQIVRRWPILVVALVIGASLIAFRLIAYIQEPGNISQTNDAVFHLNAIRYIEDIGSASSLQVSGFVGGTGFYPAAWHGVVSLVVLITGASIPVAANAFTIVIGAIIWTTGIAWLARAVSSSTMVAAYAAVLAGTLQTFPVLMFQWGVLYPNALSTALIPAALALVVELPHVLAAIARRPVARAILGALFVAVAASAILLSQPAAFLIWGLLAMIALSARVIRAGRGMRLMPVLAAVAGWIVLAVVWFLFSRSTSGAHWGASEGKAEAVINVLLNSQVTLPAAWAVSILAVVGLVASAVRPATRWVVVAWLALSALYVIVASAGRHIFREVLLAPWYADPSRIASVAPVIVIPLAAMGVGALVRLARRVVVRRSDVGVPARLVSAGVGGAVVVVIALVALVVIPVATPTFLKDNNVDVSTYRAGADSYLSTDERELLERLPELVPADAVIIGNPSTGAGFGFALSGRDVVPRTWSAPQTAQFSVLAESLRDAATDPAVCPALHAYGDVDYVLDFGEGDTTPGRWLMPGMTDFAGQPGFTEVDAIGDASLWRITACGD
ncbi:DUF6541 family protein [Microbacterium gorillae]|uniref:DUF6541 family protein n=1 Tax=Microbacterium gorillae TaxID=1231063 RepID=UPI00058D4CF0|nr:DUF6541 family protein [Microbacterium gorillae]